MCITETTSINITSEDIKSLVNSYIPIFEKKYKDINLVFADYEPKLSGMLPNTFMYNLVLDDTLVTSFYITLFGEVNGQPIQILMHILYYPNSFSYANIWMPVDRLTNATNRFNHTEILDLR